MKRYLKEIGFVFITIMAVVCFLSWRIHYGAGGYDESFYLTIAHRLTKGDALLTEKWHVSQLSSILLYPFMKVYIYFFSTEGMVLAFRYIYIGVKVIVALAVYYYLRIFNKTAAGVCMLMLLLFTPYNLYQLCYNSMGLLFMALFGSAYAYTLSRHSKITAFLCGLYLACSILCCPYLAAVYVLLFVCIGSCMAEEKMNL